MSGFPTVAELVPHSGPMCLLSRVLDHSPARTVCAVHPDRSELFRDASGAVPGWVGLEYMAQCMAVHAGLESGPGGQRPALLLGSRRMRIAVDAFPTGSELVVSASHHRGEDGLISFDCEIREATGGPTLVEGRVNVYTLNEEWAP